MFFPFFRKRKKIIKFGISGAISAIFDIGILAILVELFFLPVMLANVISFSVAVINSYILNKYWTFRDGGKNHVKQFAKFFVVSAIGLFLNMLLMWILLHFDVWYIFAKVFIILVVSVWNFSINNIWTFTSQKIDDSPKK
jgi:putative flippase GtrA